MAYSPHALWTVSDSRTTCDCYIGSHFRRTRTLASNFKEFRMALLLHFCNVRRAATCSNATHVLCTCCSVRSECPAAENTGCDQRNLTQNSQQSTAIPNALSLCPFLNSQTEVYRLRPQQQPSIARVQSALSCFVNANTRTACHFAILSNAVTRLIVFSKGVIPLCCLQQKSCPNPSKYN